MFLSREQMPAFCTCLVMLTLWQVSHQAGKEVTVVLALFSCPMGEMGVPCDLAAWPIVWSSSRIQQWDPGVQPYSKIQLIDPMVWPSCGTPAWPSCATWWWDSALGPSCVIQWCGPSVGSVLLSSCGDPALGPSCVMQWCISDVTQLWSCQPYAHNCPAAAAARPTTLIFCFSIITQLKPAAAK